MSYNDNPLRKDHTMFDHKVNLTATALVTAATGVSLLVVFYAIDGVAYLMNRHHSSN